MPARDRVEVEILAKTQKSVDSLKNLIFGAGGLMVAQKAWQALKKAVTDAVKAYQVQERAEMKLTSALKATKNAVGMTESSMKAYAKEMQRVTEFGDEAIIGAQALMTTFTQVGRDVFPMAIEAAADMSTMFGQDLQQSVIQLGTALNDPIQGVGRLKRIGISFSETQRQQIKDFVAANDIMSAQKVILDELNVEFGGVAKTVGGSATAALTQFGNALGDTQEIAGRLIVKGIEPAVRGLTKLTDAVNEYADGWLAAAKLSFIAVLNLEDTAVSVEDLERALKFANEENLSFSNFLRKLTGQHDEYTAALERGIDARYRAAAAQDFKNKMYADEQRQENERAKWGIKREEIEKALAEQLAVVAAKEKALGDAYDDAAEKAKLVQKAIEDMIEFGFTPEGAGIQRILDLYGEYITIKEDVAKATEELWQPIDELGEKELAAVVAGTDLNQTLYDLVGPLGLVYEGTKNLGQTTGEELIPLMESEEEKALRLATSIDAMNSAMEYGNETAKKMAAEGLKELEQQSEQTANTMMKTLGPFTDALGMAATDSEKAWEMMKEAAKDATAKLLEMLAKEAFVRAAMAAASLRFARAAAWTAAGVAALVASGYVKSLAEGGDFVATKPQMLLVGDNPTQRERVTATPMAPGETNGGGNGMVHVTVMLGARTLYDDIQTAVRDRQIIIRERDLAP